MSAKIRRATAKHITAGFMLQIRTHRLNAGISRKAAAESIGMEPSQWSHMEAGRYRTSLETVYLMGEAVGLRVGLFPNGNRADRLPAPHEGSGLAFGPLPKEHADLFALDGSELDAVRHLVVSYVRHALRERKPVPVELVGAAAKWEPKP